MPNIVKGSDMAGLLRYLAGPGREHTNPQIIAGDVVTMGVFAGPIGMGTAAERARVAQLAKLLDTPRQTVLRGEPVLVTNYRKAHALIAEGADRREAFEAATRDQNVWHCSLSLDPNEGQLDVEVWSRVAQDFMREMGLTGRADGAPDVRWAAAHHGLTKAGGDHIHIVMSVVRPDGTLADVRRDWPRSQAAATVLEKKYGLAVLASREDGATEQATRPDERARAERVGAPETDREAMRRRVRALAVGVEDEAEFVRELRAAKLVLRPRYAKGGTDEVVGYAIRMPTQRNVSTGTWEKAIWYSGGQLGKDLTLTALRSWAGWDDSADAREAALVEWQRSGKSARADRIRTDPRLQTETIAELRQWSDRMRQIPLSDQDGWARAASRTAGVFAGLSVRTETKPGALDRLSRQLARAGQLPAHRRNPRPQRDTRVQAVTRALWMMRTPASANLALVYALGDLLRTVGEMLAAQQQAKAAAVLAAHSKRALTEIHMRAEDVDPTKPFDTRTGSPAWVAHRRAQASLAGEDPAAVEVEVRGRRAVYAQMPPEDSRRRAQGPLTPPTPGPGGPARPAQRLYPGSQPPGRDRGRDRGRGQGR